MLDSLYVKNLALIDKAEVNFTKGLNVLSGETGAGKSIIIGSVLVALGAKVSKDMIRKNETEAYIELIFSPEHPSVLKRLKEYDIQPEDGQLIISKKITMSKSISKINGETYPASKVKEIASMLLDVHGQHDYQVLLDPAKQLDIIDRNAGEEIEKLKADNAAAYYEWKKYAAKLKEYNVNEDERIRRCDILKYEINELENAAIVPGEEEALLQKLKEISAREQLINSFSQVKQLLGYENGACDMISEAENAMKSVEDVSDDAKDIFSQLVDAESVISDALRQAEMVLDGFDEDCTDVNEIENRLDEIQHLMQKYRCNEQQLLDLLKDKQSELEKYENFDEQCRVLTNESEKSRAKLNAFSDKLSDKRKASADEFKKKLIAALVDLNFLDVRFEVKFDKADEPGAGGYDKIVFYIALNPGESIRPLASVASGGELSRIMLAIKSVMAEKEEIETLIFDEIDTGISGRTAQKVADRLAVIAAGCQVICISHLAQIVSTGNTHFLIEKSVEQDRTATHIRQLTADESINEIARLLGGSRITQSVLETAKEMKEMAAR